MTRQPRRDVFRTTAGFRWVIVGVTMLFVAMLGIAFVTGPPTLFYGFVALTVFGVLGIAETMVTRIELHDDRIVAVAFFVRRTSDTSRSELSDDVSVKLPLHAVELFGNDSVGLAELVFDVRGNIVEVLGVILITWTELV